MSEPVRVVVVDDEPMVCAHLRTILGSAPDVEVVDDAQDGAAAVEAVVVVFSPMLPSPCLRAAPVLAGGAVADMPGRSRMRNGGARPDGGLEAPARSGRRR